MSVNLRELQRLIYIYLKSTCSKCNGDAEEAHHISGEEVSTFHDEGSSTGSTIRKATVFSNSWYKFIHLLSFLEKENV